jgi:hypothetical protein
LALSGGAARGLAHIGVIRALEEASVEIDLIGGAPVAEQHADAFSRENSSTSQHPRAASTSARVSRHDQAAEPPNRLGRPESFAHLLGWQAREDLRRRRAGLGRQPVVAV